ncbi:MAG: RIP metalloprotease RseP [Nitrospiria bacterium]
MIVTILSFVLVLGVLIFIHELGHFLVARKVGVKVLTFSIGFGPKLLKRTMGDTEYALSAFPLGGYVRLLGDDPKEVVDQAEVHRSFLNQSVSKKMAIVFAGPLFNMLLALIIFVAIFMFGVQVLTAEVGEVQEGSPAQQAGLLTGDVVVAIDGQKVTQWENIRDLLQASGGREIAVVLNRGRETLELRVLPVEKEDKNIFGEPQMSWKIGIGPKGTFITKHYDPLSAVYLGTQKTWEITELTVVGIVKLIQGKLPAKTIGGPIMIAQLAGQQAAAGLLSVVIFIAILSINLGVINLLPIPILDGGHLVFFAIEGIMGRPISMRKREVAQQIGLFILISLMLFAIYNDVDRIITGPKE